MLRWEYTNNDGTFDESAYRDELQAMERRYPSDLLLDEQEEDYLAWNVAGRDPQKYRWILDNYDLFDLTEAYAFKRIDRYLDTEDDDELNT